MKKWLLLSLSILLVNQLRTQSDSLKAENRAAGKVSYLHVEHGMYQEYRNGRATLFFNPVKSIYILDDAPKTDIAVEKGDVTQYVTGDPEGFPVYKLHAEKKILFKTNSPLVQGLCVVEDTLGAINWTILTEKKQFGLIVCQKATGAFRGRTYEAWFALDIPISSGPFKLGGLPGLILEARSLDGEVEFLFQSLDVTAHVNGLILPPTGKYMNMNYEAFKKAEALYLRKKEKEYLAKGIMVTISKPAEGIEKQ